MPGIHGLSGESVSVALIPQPFTANAHNALHLDPSQLALFERTVLVHLDDAYTLARYLTRDEHDAQDVVQEACLRAVRHFGGYRGGDARAWLLTIVRHACYTWLRRGREAPTIVELDDAIVGTLAAEDDTRLEEASLVDELRAAIDRLPREFKEAIVLREIEGLTYDEISRVLGVPRGTVMSRLSRGRKRLQSLIAHPLRETG